MNEQLMIYLWSISEQLSAFPLILCLLLLFVAFTFAVLDRLDLAKNISITAFCILPLAILINILTPSRQDLALILLYPTAKTTVQSFSPEMDKFHEVLNLSLDNQIKELKSGKVSK